jgi:hypothetical protein
MAQVKLVILLFTSVLSLIGLGTYGLTVKDNVRENSHWTQIDDDDDDAVFTSGRAQAEP